MLSIDQLFNSGWGQDVAFEQEWMALQSAMLVMSADCILARGQMDN